MELATREENTHHMVDQTPQDGYTANEPVHYDPVELAGAQVAGEEEVLGAEDLQEEIVDDENIEEYM